MVNYQMLEYSSMEAFIPYGTPGLPTTPLCVGDMKKFTRYGGYCGNKLPWMDQNQQLLPCSTDSWFFKG